MDERDDGMGLGRDGNESSRGGGAVSERKDAQVRRVELIAMAGGLCSFVDSPKRWIRGVLSSRRPVKCEAGASVYWY